MNTGASNRVVATTVAVAALGYFVDMYDIILFNVVRRQSLLSLGVAEADLLNVGIRILDYQLIGMIIGGIGFGILGDKRGRLSVLFASILLYSVANAANAYITTVEQYALLRFLAGIGLAGELGVGITLVSEIMTPAKRGYGTMLVATIGVLGASFAAFVGMHLDWRTAYLLGGGMGLVLLLLRVGVRESAIFTTAKARNEHRADFLAILRQPRLVGRFLQCIIIGAPTFYTISILVSGAPEFGQAFGMAERPTAEMAILILYIFVSLSDILCSVVSQWLGSRRQAMAVFLGILLSGMVAYLVFPAQSLTGFYVRVAWLGLGIGIWAVLITTISELFGTNIRATATTAIPNFIRAFFIPLSFTFKALTPSLGLVNSAALVGIGSVILSGIMIYRLPETFGRDLSFDESLTDSPAGKRAELAKTVGTESK